MHRNMLSTILASYIHFEPNIINAILLRRHFSDGLERWKCIDGYSQYEASTFGNVRNSKLGKIRNINYARFKSINASASVMIKSDSGEWNSFLVSRLLLRCFDPKDDTDGLFAIHIDGDKYNNNLSNLEWSESIYKP
eukprot:30012_1